MHAKFVFGSGQQFLEEFTLKNFKQFRVPLIILVTHGHSKLKFWI